SYFYFFFSSRRRHTRCLSDWSSDVCSSDLLNVDDRAPAAPRFHSRLKPKLQRVSSPPQPCERRVDGLGLGRPRVAPRQFPQYLRSEERRVGKEGRCRWL